MCVPPVFKAKLTREGSGINAAIEVPGLVGSAILKQRKAYIPPLKRIFHHAPDKKMQRDEKFEKGRCSIPSAAENGQAQHSPPYCKAIHVRGTNLTKIGSEKGWPAV